MSEKWLRCLIIILGVLLAARLQASAQSKDRPAWLSFYIGHHEYHGDLGNEILDFNLGYDWTVGLAVDQYLNNYLDLEIAIAYGELDYKNFFNTSFLNSHLLLQLKPFGAGFIIDPFIGTGLGISSFWSSQLTFENTTSLHIPIQIGFDYYLSKNVSTTASATYNRTFTNSIDGIDSGSMDHDDYLVYSLGIKISLNKSRDSDADGIRNNEDLCPDSYGSSFWGCPDTDGDGLYDNEDNCPSDPGKPLLNGCPDTDDDGVEDSKDKCPGVTGSYRFQGCPDKDNDGLPDQIDKCPDRAETTDTGGCPEGGKATDSNREISDELADKLSEFARNIAFEPNSSALDSTSLPYLDQLADIMFDDEALQLIIRSYTDDTGNSLQNLELSIARAAAVKKYLVEKGLNEKRLYAFGYGQAKPVASNNTLEGQAKNRRIELQLYYTH